MTTKPGLEWVISLTAVKSSEKYLDKDFLSELIRRFGLVNFVETGTYLGDSTAVAAELFDEVHSIELSKELAARAADRFGSAPRVHIYNGDSAEHLPEILKGLARPTLFWLDGHYSSGITAKGRLNTPILDELRFIHALGPKGSVLLIDDLRLFETARPGCSVPESILEYPTAKMLQGILTNMGYHLTILGDVGLAVPSQFNCEFSPLLNALTASRLYDGANLTIEEIIHAEKAIVLAHGKEREVLRGLCGSYSDVECFGLGLHYRFWRGLSLLLDNHYLQAVEEFRRVMDSGFTHWRLKWYLALVTQQLNEPEVTASLLQALLQDEPNFTPARELLLDLSTKHTAASRIGHSIPTPNASLNQKPITSAETMTHRHESNEVCDAVTLRKRMVEKTAAGYHVEAGKDAIKCLEFDSCDVTALECLSVCQIETQKFKDAQETLERLLKIQPEHKIARETIQKLAVLLSSTPSVDLSDPTQRKESPTTNPGELKPALRPGEDPIPLLKELGLWSSGRRLKLHLGCGENHLAGYVNIDYPPSEHTVQSRQGADVFGDITRLEFPSGSVDEVRLHHVFEHFVRAQALALVIQWHEWLKVGGVLLIETPDVLGCAEQLLADLPYRTKQAVMRHAFGSHEAHWANHYDGWHAQKFENVLGRLGFSTQCRQWRWPHEPHLANVDAVATKTRCMRRSELLQAADSILEESMVAEVPSERAMWEVWRKGLRESLRLATAIEPGSRPAPTAIKSPPVASPAVHSNSSLPTVVVKLQGGLGNQMFQYAAGLALARRQGVRLKLDLGFLLDRTPQANFTYREYCLNLFNLPPDCEVLEKSANADHLPRFVEQQFHFDPRFLELNGDVYLDGYWQSPRYFESIQDELRSTFSSLPTPLTVEQQALANLIDARESVCLNVRRGDYVTNPVTKAWHGVCQESYFQEAVAWVRRRVPDAHFFVFSDDIEWCRNVNLVGNSPVTFVSHDYAGDRFGIYLQLMARCRHFILPNSSFGWWAAFLRTSVDKVVIVPEPWFESPANDTSDLLPSSWIRLPKGRSAGPKVSVVVSCHNYASYLAEAVESILQQSYRNFEIVLVDDGSTDGSLALAKQLAAEHEAQIPIRVFHLNDVGPSAARRFGIRQARGRYYLPLDADDRIAPDLLAKSVPVLDANPELGFAYVDTVYFEGVEKRHEQPEYDFKALCHQNFISYCSLVRKAAFDEVGGYDPENWGYYEDWDLWIRLGSRGWAGHHVAEPLFFYRHHFDSSLSLFSQRLAPVYQAFLISRHSELYPAEQVSQARSLLEEMPSGWNSRPPMRRIEDLRALLIGFPKNRHITFFLALALSKAGQVTEAISLLQAMLEDRKDDREAKDLLARLSGPRKAPLVSVIVPTFKRPELLKQALCSILNQSFKDFEIIVVNDAGSEVDSVVAPLNTQGQIFSLRHETNRGLGAARNTGLRAARGRYIAYLDDDDLFYPDHLQTLVDFLSSHPGTVAYTDANRAQQELVEGRWVITRRELVYSRDWDNEEILIHNFVPVLCFMHEKQALVKSGIFDESLDRHEDWDLWIRLSQHYPFRHIPKVTCEFSSRTDGSTMTSQGAARFLATMEKIHARYAALVGDRRDLLDAQRSARETLRAGIGGRPADGLGGPMAGLNPQNPGAAPAECEFDEGRYLNRYPDVAEEVREGRFESGWEHFTKHGIAENRRWFLKGASLAEPGSGSEASPAQPAKPAATHGKAAPVSVPLVSIVIPVFNLLDMTRRCLHSLQEHSSDIEYEIIVVDNGSADGTSEWLRQVARDSSGRIRQVVNALNLGFAKASNQGARAARGRYILFLNNDTEVLSGWLKPLLSVLERDASVAAVGSKLLFPDGTIQHAGVVISVQQSSGHIGPFHIYYKQAADLPEANQPREYNVCTGACLLTRADMFREAKGFDEAFWNGYEDVDLCLRFRQRGWRVIYQPASVVKHYESQSGAERFSKEQRNIELLQKKWRHKLSPDVVVGSDGKARLQKCMAIKPYSVPVVDKLTRAVPGVPRVSIVIPVFNNLALTRNCLESLFRTKVATNFEVIVVDNASTDGTAEFLKIEAKDGRLGVLTNSSNLGFARACNLGAQAAKGSLFVFLNNDTQVTDGWLDVLAGCTQQTGVGIVGARLLYADNRIQHAGIEFINGVPDHPHRHAPGDSPSVNQFRELDMVTGACLMIQRGLFFQLAGFDEAYCNGVEDIDLCLRVRAAGRKVVYQPKAAVYHLEGQSVGRFDHVRENLALFFERWRTSFNSDWRFTCPTPARIIPASRSLLLVAPAATNTSPIAVVWEGSFLDFGSLSHVNRELTRALGASSQRISLDRLNKPALPKGQPVKAPLAKLAGEVAARPRLDVQITVRQGWPPDWSRPAKGKLVVIQPWEFGSLPKQWVERAPGVDEFWVPSSYVRRIYTESGIEPGKVQVVPNGIDPELFRPEATPRKLATGKSYKFLFVGGTIPRKGIDILLEAFLNNFTAADDVALVIKDFGGNTFYKGQTCRDRIAEVRRRAGAPEILYLEDELAPAELPGLYTSCDCLVHPYRGEGFGLPILEAMACGLPVIVTAGGASDDFTNSQIAYHVPASRREIGDTVSGTKLAGPGWLLEPDGKALAERMKWAAEHREESRALGLRASAYARHQWTWSEAARIAADRLCALQAASNRASNGVRGSVARPPLATEKPCCARLGELAKARASLANQKTRQAWENVCASVKLRPYHPEAFLLLAQIAQTAGDGASARSCGEYARLLALEWKAARQFQNRRLKGNSRPSWLVLPAFGKQPGDRLSVCVIAKNEARSIERCLASVKPIADQLVVVDTGSTDGTVEIAKSFGAEVHHFDWCDDFSAARNAALEHARGDWVLILDADEELPQDQHARLRADLKNRKAIALRLPLINKGQEAEGRSCVPRLFRNAPGVYFSGRIHEQVFPSLIELGKAWGLGTGLGTAQILHHGYSKEAVKDRNKIERNLNLLRKAIEECPDDANLAMNLGLELVRSGDLESGLLHYRQAFELMAAKPADQTAPELSEALLTQFTCHLYKTHAHQEVVEVLTSPLAKRGGLTASLHFALGLAYFETGQHNEAAEQMRQCLAKRKQPALTPINTDILTAAPYHCLAMSLAKAGRPGDAEKAFQSGLTETGRGEELRLDYAKFLVDQNRHVDALNRLHELITANAGCAAAWRLGAQIALTRPDFLEFACDWTAEAIKQLPKDKEIVSQRAEALLLNQQTAVARGLWQSLWEQDHQHRALAALLICDIVEDSPLNYSTANEPDFGPVSREFIDWYQRFLGMRLTAIVTCLNQRVDALRGVLPAVAGMLESALTEADGQPAATPEPCLV